MTDLERWMEELKIDGMNPGDLSVKAQEGDPDAQCYIGLWLLKNNAGDADEAYSWLEKAAEQKQVSACLFLNELWRTSGSPAVRKKAVDVIERIQDLPEGKEGMAVCYALGQGMPKNPERAEELFVQAARMMGCAGMLKLARRYKDGDCLPASITRCMYWMGLAMEAGAADAWQVVFAGEIEEKERRRRAEEELQADLTGAEEGDPARMLAMALRRADGRGVEKDLAAAMDWLKKAAQQGPAEVQYMLACRYEQGDWGEQDPAEAERLYELAALQGHEAACLRMFAYCAGEECTRSEEDILNWTERAAALGHPDALFSMALRLEEGRGVEQDGQAGWDKMCQAAEGGNCEAQYRVGLYHTQLPLEERNYITAVDWFHKAAQQGHAAAQYELGRCREKGWGTDMGNAAHWYEQAALQGHPAAQNALGVCLFHGKGTAKDRALAFQWVEKGARQGYAPAQSNMGVRYYQGYGVGKDPAKAVTWFQKGCEQGHAKSQYWMGRCCAEGAGIGKDLFAAVDWYEKAAAQEFPEAEKELENDWAQVIRAARGEDADAKFRLAQMLEKGTAPFEANVNAAMEWYERSAALEHAQAMVELGRLNFGREKLDAAIEWYERAAALGQEQAADKLEEARELRDAKAGQAEAQYRVGCRKEKEGDRPAAMKWYRKAADQDHAQAQYDLARCCEAEANYISRKEAKEWYSKAAALKYGPAMLWMGRYEEDGKRFRSALDWYEKAEKQGCEGAADCVSRCREPAEKEEEAAERARKKKLADEARKKRRQAAEWAMGAVLAVLLVIAELLALGFCVMEPELGDVPTLALVGILLVDLFVLAPWRRLRGFGTVSRAVILAAAIVFPLWPLVSGGTPLEQQWTWIPVFAVLFAANLLWNRHQDEARAGVMTLMLAVGFVMLRRVVLADGRVELYDFLLWAGAALATDLWIHRAKGKSDRWAKFGSVTWHLILLGGTALAVYTIFDWGYLYSIFALLFPALCIALLVQRCRVDVAGRTKELQAVTVVLSLLMLYNLLRGCWFAPVEYAAVWAGLMLWNAAAAQESRPWHVLRCVELVAGIAVPVYLMLRTGFAVGYVWLPAASVALLIREGITWHRFMEKAKTKAAAAKYPYRKY